MIEAIEKFLSDLMIALLLARVYPEKHPKVKEAQSKAYVDLCALFEEKNKLIIGVMGDELAFENEIFFDLSKNVKQGIGFLKQKAIETITFYQGLREEEFEAFISYLVTTETAKKDAQESLVVRGIKNISVGKIKVSGAVGKDELSDTLKFLRQYEGSLDEISQFIDNALDNKIVDYMGLRFSVINVMENLLNAQQEFLKLTTLKRLDISTFVHILNVSILSMYLAYKMGFSKDDVMDIGIAGLYHDIGKLYISRKILAKAGVLTDEEFTSIRSHTVLGAQILLKYTDSMGILPVVVAFEHHLRYDCKGYPKLAFIQKPHIASLIVSVCDVYDALCGRRTYKRDYPPDMVYNIMMKDKGTAFEPAALDKFFKIIGVWPIGAIVALSDKRIAVVKEENEDDIFSPKVEVISPPGSKELIDLKEKKDTLKIDHALNPLAEGKEYLELLQKQEIKQPPPPTPTPPNP